jgi:hypothetical protein
VSTTDGEHTITIQAHDNNSVLLAETSIKVNIRNLDNVQLALDRHEPENASTGNEPTAFIGLYFNKPVDPALLQINVKETAHGLTYDMSASQGSTPLLEGNTTKLVEVHRDQTAVAGGISVLPGATAIAFYPDSEYAYNAEIYVEVAYDGQELTRFQFKVRPLPTFLQGFASDSLMQPINGLTVSLPDINRTVITDNQGNFKFGFGDTADNTLPDGRHRIVYNPGRKNPQYGSIENWVNIEEGRLTQIGVTVIPILLEDIPFRRIASGESNVILANGDLTLDLSQASLSFPDGRNRGDAHVQFMLRQNVPYQAPPSVLPTNLFAVQPQGIAVNGKVNVSINMPMLYGTYDYIPADGSLVLMVGFNGDTKQLVPVGVGQINSRKVNNVTDLQLSHLDYLGYVLKGEQAQNIMQQYVDGAIGFQQMVIELDGLAKQ